MAKRRFLTAQWRNWLMLNYEVDPAILKPHLPAFTELDLWNGKVLVSMVGFMFLDTRVMGIKWPFHINFEEVNLRFYVRYFDGKEWKRGAVFISELVPKHIIPVIANNLYNEHYKALPMRHNIVPIGNDHTYYDYQWKFKGRWNKLGATISNVFTDIQLGSAEEFIFEHYWGYNRMDDSKALEYAVEHVSWQVAVVKDPVFEGDIAALYGAEFEPFLKRQPYSAFFANGSEVAVRIAGKIETAPIPPV
ncbi:YqjF family protein [Mucilaginibacter agri]|uniref:DUF2071 domain-containing protein n=1 Tax=Mucilaginibacter agri TaxID=2695265 RepID=A0A966DR08_9SPHI|nr:DUF2071 domain-containing protein [Mucilaginibacter agri]NCD68528.1 DUF2071 domain-containing protein [Mucilaginibacter agri]